MMRNPEKQSSLSSAPEISLPEAEMQKSAESWWRTQSATMALLKHAYHLLRTSEERLAEQEKRIQQLEDLASTDPLTGLMNRRGFEKFFAHELERIHRLHSPGAVFILIDLDRFKQINDIYGHLAGDACLKLTAEKLLSSSRILDGATRLGGDELALLFTQIAPEKAQSRAQKIHHELNDMTLDWQGEKLHFGASVGMATVGADSTFTDVYQKADADLYADKQRRKKRAKKA